MRCKHLTRPLEVKKVTEAGEFAGYGSVFGVIDSYRERVAPGAFKASLKEHREKDTMPAMLWQHAPSQPVGVFTVMREDDRGLYVEGKLALDTQQGKEAHALLGMGAVRGLSIGFLPRKSEVDETADPPIVTLTEVELWEVSIVTFPANPDANVEAVRARMEGGEVPTKRDAERILRDAGFSRARAKALLAHGYEGLMRDAQTDDVAGSLEDLSTTLRRLTE